MIQHFRFNALRAVRVALGAASSVALAGCAGMVNAPGSAPLSAAAVQGKIMGGETPISGANVILWQTDPANGGYGSSAAVKLASTTSGSGGGFSFTTGYTCTPGQFVYVTATGGDVSNGNNMVNNNQVQLAAVGSCDNFATATQQGKAKILLNEVSTVAAAYALGNFITVSPSTTGNQLVYIGAPANNNATTGACTGTGSAMTCVAAGLAHAFANAIMLSDSVRTDGSFPSGNANVTVPGNSLGSIPQAEIHTLANVLQYCTNTTGGAAPSGVSDGSNCGNLFAAAAPSTTNVPTDELSAIIDISKNPKHNVSSTPCGTPPSSIFCFAPATGAAFQPQLATAPSDWSLSIAYTGLSVGTANTSFGFPEYVTLDANDNVYVAAGNVGSASNTTAGVVAMTSSGAGLWANPQTNQFCYAGSMSTDTVGNVWFANGPTSTEATSNVETNCWYGVTSFSTSTGAVTNAFSPSTPVNGSPADTTHSISSQSLNVAIDKLNNVWYARKSTSCSTCLEEFPYIAGTPATYGAPQFAQATGNNILEMLFDPSGDFYASDTAAATAWVLKNTGTTATPAYGTLASVTPGVSGTGLIAFDSSGNLWVGGVSKLSEFAAPVVASESPTTTTTITSTVSNSTSPSKPYPGEVDGANVLWYPSYTSSGQIWFTQLSTSGLTSDYIYTCYAPQGATTCSQQAATVAPAAASPRNLQIDSTGAIWVSGQASGLLLQILGPAAPAWPQLSYAVYGTSPH
jgi:hypothetical protein